MTNSKYPAEWVKVDKRQPLGKDVDCDVCIAKAGEACYLQTTTEERRRGADIYYRGDSGHGKERFHLGVRLQPKVTDKQTNKPKGK